MVNLARTTVKIFLANAGRMVISFGGIIFFSRELGAHQIGVFFLFQALLGILAIPADFGIGRGVMKRLSEGQPSGTVISTAIALKLVPLTGLCLGVLLFQKQINEYLGAELAVYLIAALVVQDAAKLMLRALEGELRVADTALPMLSRQVVFVGVGAALLLTGFGVLSLVYGLLAGLSIMLAWGAYRSSLTVGRPSLSQARSLVDYSKYSFVSSVGGYVYGWMDIAIIGLLLTQSAVGVYEIAWRITAVVMLFSTAISTTLYPQVSKWDAEDATEHIEQILPKAIVVPLFFSIPAFFGTVVLSRDILGLVFGPEYAAGWLVLIVLMSEKSFQSVYTILGRTLQGIDRPDLAAKAITVTIGLNLVLNVVLIWEFGIVGAAVATAAAFAANCVIHYYYTSRFVTIRIPFTRVVGATVAGIGMAFVLWGMQTLVTIDTLPRLGFAVCLGVAVYAGFAFLIPPTRDFILENTRGIVESVTAS